MWLSRTVKDGATFGTTGKLFWFRPDATLAEHFTEIPIPSTVNVMDLKETAHIYGGSMYFAGGYTDNMVLTPDLLLWQQGIRPPTAPPDVTAGVGSITASVIPYLSWFDARTNERSALSAAGDTLALSAQGAQWSNLPTDPQNARVTHIELWRSVDGSLPRLVMQRQVGVTSVLETVAVGDLGEAFTEDFEKFPRCRFNVVWRDRQVMAGDDENPDTIYLSLIGFPERKEISVRTKSGQPVIGLAIVRDTLLVFCPRATEVMTGFTADDLAIEIFQPQIGALSNWSILNIHGMLWVWNHLGLSITDGAGWFYASKDIQTKFESEYRVRRDPYERSWAAHDPNDNVGMVYVENHSDTQSLFTFWVGTTDNVTPQEGGSIGQPNWSYDTSTRQYGCGAVLALPGARRGDLYLGGADGIIYKANNYDPSVPGYDNDAEDTNEKTMVIRTGSQFFADYGGDLAHGKRFTEIDDFMQSENDDWTLNLYAGDEFAYPARAATKTFEIVASELTSSGDFVFQPKTVHQFGLVNVTGRAIVRESITPNPHLVEWRGHQVYWKEGPAPRRESNVELGGG